MFSKKASAISWLNNSVSVFWFKEEAFGNLEKTWKYNLELSTIKYFEDEYRAHIYDKKCPAGACQKLKTITIDPELCKGCSKCARNCPVSAIKGEIKKPFTIDQKLCIKCGACLSNCPFKAIKEV